MPRLVLHADWSLHPRKRWVSRAWEGNEGWRVEAPSRAPDPAAWLDDLEAMLDGNGSVVLGLDLPLGLPAAYAKRTGVTSFPGVLPQWGRGEWRDFYRVAERSDEVSLRRPFYPAASNRRGVRRADLVRGLGVCGYDALLRRCDRATTDRPAACSVFWTLGPQQVGKAAITGWRGVVAPLIERLGDRVGLWPFDGDWASLQHTRELVVAESYPRQFYATFGFPHRGWSKRRPRDRAARFGELQRWASARSIALTDALHETGQAGLGEGPAGEDAFDAVVGAVGTAACVSGAIPVTEPTDEAARRVEGWILGQPAV